MPKRRKAALKISHEGAIGRRAPIIMRTPISRRAAICSRVATYRRAPSGERALIYGTAAYIGDHRYA